MSTTFIYCCFKCEVHTKSNDSVSRDNALADLAELVVSVHVKLCPSLNANDIAYSNDVVLPRETADVKET